MAKKDSQRIIEIREKANRQRREQQRREKRKTLFIQLGIAVGVIAIIGAIIAVVMVNNNNRELTAGPASVGSVQLPDADAAVPLLVGDTAVTVGNADAPVTIDLWEDYSCPHCADYAAAVDSTLFSLVAKGDVVVNFHPIRFVTNYGVAAGSAATCVAANDSQNWPEFHMALFANHSQQSDGWSANQFEGFAQAQGVTDEATLSCIRDETYADWILANTEASRDANVQATPTLIIDGEIQETLLGPDQLIDAVNQLKGN